MSGPYEKNQLILSVQNERLDWQLAPVDAPEFQNQPTLTLLGEGLLPLLERAARLSVELSYTYNRMAFSPVLVRGVLDTTEGMRQLSQYLPQLGLDEGEGRDLSYQINRRRRSRQVPHATINRIARWSLLEVGRVSVNLGPTRGSVLEQVSTVRQLMIDINTTPETNAIAKSRYPVLLDEMINWARELATRGDVP